MRSLLCIGIDLNFQDLDRRTVLHHLTYNAGRLHPHPDVSKLLLESGVKINILDKYERSPIFYCFSEMEGVDQTVEPL